MKFELGNLKQWGIKSGDTIDFATFKVEEKLKRQGIEISPKEYSEIKDAIRLDQFGKRMEWG
jgi:hypothetical protein